MVVVVLVSLLYFAEQLAIEGLSHKTLAALCDAKLVSSPADLFRLDTHRSILETWPGWYVRFYRVFMCEYAAVSVL
jgi:hypothetical protein